MSLKNKVIIVTGAAAGIGAATAKLFLERGSKVVLTDLNIDSLKDIVKDFENEKYLLKTCDVSKEDQIQGFIKETVEAFGQLDVLVNNAGIYGENEFTQTTTEGGISS